MTELLVKPVSLDELAQLLASIVPERSFDIQALSAMTCANAEVMRRMLLELRKNLEQERGALEVAAELHNWEGLAVAVHRLKGIACLIDAIALAHACADLDSCVRLKSNERVAADWQALKQAIERVLEDIEPHLQVDIPAF